jgi:two-component system chemotaxis response regulator CheV
MNSQLRNAEARSTLAGTNKLEILLFSVGPDPATGHSETFGINVFKVREVMRAPSVTRAPDMPAALEGMVSLRGTLVPVINLARYAGITAAGAAGIIIVAEYSGHTLGFLVASVHSILRVDWSAMRVPPPMIGSHAGGVITAVTELSDGRLVMMLDVERILAELVEGAGERAHAEPAISVPAGRTVFFADDSAAARKQIARTLDALHVRHLSAVNGARAWDELRQIAATAQAAGRPVKDYLQLVLTDVEMPEMDGYMLAKHIKSDARFAGIPVVMHSSLSSASNRELGMSVGVDDYVPKVGSHALAPALARLLAEASS